MANQENDTAQAERRHQILEAALKVFSTKGFQKATNKDIAEAAGISPGLIYWYFKDKQDLFLSIIRERAPIFTMLAQTEQLMGLPPEQALVLVARAFLGAYHSPVMVGIFRMLISEAIRFPQIAEMFYSQGLSTVLHALSAYMARQMEAGRLRQGEPMLAARTFMGMLVVHILAREVLRQPEAIALSDQQVIDNAVAVFLHGMRPDSV
ncbi:MAG TPA: TetR/AcrR family transcriptional regulator [Roseiflexaceae bacterium]|nr:TetR/AcrR family transcriptional regulator [Roseiflexaceae bacterium]